VTFEPHVLLVLASSRSDFNNWCTDHDRRPASLRYLCTGDSADPLKLMHLCQERFAWGADACKGSHYAEHVAESLLMLARAY
jgi:hypothetical protein